MNTNVAKLVEEESIEVTEEPLPDPADGEVTVQIKRCGICGSDLNYFRHAGLGSHKKSLPLDMGHEPSGVVIDPNGSSVVDEGARVAIDPGLHCGECAYCRQGKFNLCQDGTFMGSHGAAAAFREYMNVAEEQLIPVGGSLSLDEAALVEPLSVPLHVLENLVDVSLTDDVAVFGAGPIGLLTIELLRRTSVGTIIAVDPLETRVEYALEHGADVGITDLDDPVSEIKRQLNDRGVDVAIEAAGEQEAFDTALRSTKPAGTMLVIGIPAVDFLKYNPHKARIKELSIINVRRANQTMDAAAKILAETPRPTDMITHRFSLDRIQEAFEVTASQDDGVIKTVIEP